MYSNMSLTTVPTASATVDVLRVADIDTSLPLGE
jgi:hypothetical protein